MKSTTDSVVKLFLIMLLVSMVLFCTKNFDNQFQEDLSSEDSTWLIDYDGDQQADSIQKYAADCNLSIEECLLVAQQTFATENVWLVDADNNDIPDSLDSYLQNCTLAADECILMARDSIKPLFSINSGTYTASQTLNITNVTGSGEIRYTVDGTDPTISSLLYVDSMTFDTSFTINAALFINGVIMSNINHLDIQITGFSSIPVFSPPPGDYPDTMRVSISTADPGGVIRFTLDGSEPSDINLGYSDSVFVGKNLTLKAITFTEGSEPSAIVSGVYRLVVSEPVANIEAGEFDTTQYVTLSSATEASTIRYTLNGSDPTGLSLQYVSPVEVLSTTRIKAQAYRPEWTSSSILNRLYEIKIPGEVSAPGFSPSPGTYITQASVLLSADSAIIYYTLDGTQPGQNSTVAVAGNPIVISSSTVINAIAFNGVGDSSSITTGSYVIKVDTPSVSLAGGVYTEAQTVSLTANSEGAGIFFTLDGSDPDSNSTQYTAPVNIPSSLTLKLISYKAGTLPSEINSFTYEINILGTVSTPNFAPDPGTFIGGGFTLLMGSNTEGASIYYTIDGSEPDETDLEFILPFPVTVSATYKARAYKEGLLPSAVGVAAYTIQVAPPAFSPIGDIYFAPQLVTLSTTPVDATIRYTLDGSQPSETTGLIYTDPILVSDSLTLNAIGYKDSLSSSGVFSATYFIELEVIPQTVDLLSPEGGETWTVGTSERISWSTEGEVDFIILDYSIDNGVNWLTIKSKATASAGFYDWIIPDNPSTTVLVRATIYGTNISSQNSHTIVIESPEESSLWAYYPFSGNAQDASGNARHANISGAELAEDKNGNSSSAYDFNGSGDVMWVPYENTVTGAELGPEFTVMLWMSIETLQRQSRLVNHTTESAGFYLEKTSFNRIRFFVNGVGNVTSERGFQRFTWTHVAATMSESGLCVYVNSQAECLEISGEHVQAAAALIFGARLQGSETVSEYFRGSLDEIQIFNRALTSEEISDIYNGLSIGGIQGD